jgi:hypothetical protein
VSSYSMLSEPIHDWVDRELVKEAFAALRAGKRHPNDKRDSYPRIMARMNFTCCGSCGGHEMHEKVVKARSAGKNILGYCFYHQQAEPIEKGFFINWGLGFESGALCSQWGLLDLTKGEGLPEDADEEALELALGNAIKITLQNFGLVVDWTEEDGISRSIGVGERVMRYE